MTPNQIKKIRVNLESLIKAQNLLKYNTMKISGELEPFLDNLIAEYVQTVHASWHQITDYYATRQMPDKVQLINNESLKAEHEALNQVAVRIMTITELSQES